MKIGLRRGVSPHVSVHARGNEHGARTRKQRGAHRVVRKAVRHLGHDVRGGRHNKRQIRPLRVVNMGDIARRVLEQIVANRVTRESLKGGCSYEALGRRGTGDADNAPGLLKTSQDLAGLVCGDTSAYGKKDLLSSELGHRYSPSWVVIRMRWQ